MFAIILFAFGFLQASGVAKTAQPVAKERYLERAPGELTKRVPELKAIQPAQDQQLLSTILSKTGARIDDFLRQVVDLTAHEHSMVAERSERAY